MISRLFPALTGLVLAVISTFSSPAIAQQIRDCRTDGSLVMPVVPKGHDLLVLHAADDLAGPSIFDRVATLPGGDRIDLSIKVFADYEDQVDAYLSCEMPFMRVTHAMMTTLAEITEADPRTRMQPVFFHGWSNGADALVSRLSDSVADLAGNRIVTDAAHLDFALQLASEVDPRPDVSIATDPAAAFAANPDIGFAVLDGAAATRITGGGVGTGAEGSVAGARKVLTTTSASRVIGDLLVVRADFMDAAPNKVDAAVRSLLKAEELVREDVKKQVVDFELAAEMLFGDPALADRVRDMWASVETVGLKGQTDWSDPADPRSYRALVNAGQSLMVETGLIDAAIPLADPSIDYAALGDGIWDKRRVNAAGFDQDAASAAIRAMSSAERDGSTIASVTILFEPNQAVFPVETYREEFEAALEKSRVYAGAVLSIEAHSSNLAYVRGVIEQDWAAKRQKRELASLNAISARRALSVRDALIEAAEGMGFSIDESQITYTGRGISDPPRGYCKGLPCPPRSEQEWREQRRVVFRVIAVESEAEVFTPLVEW